MVVAGGLVATLAAARFSPAGPDPDDQTGRADLDSGDEKLGDSEQFPD
jgi:hypothetical protein